MTASPVRTMPMKVGGLIAKSVNFGIDNQRAHVRRKVGISQARLARRIDVPRSVISRVEDADYEEHSLAMFNRIAAALQRRVEIRCMPHASLLCVPPETHQPKQSRSRMITEP